MVPSLFVPATREALLDRLAKLDAQATRQWGKMDVAQMLTHCALALETASGDNPRTQRLLGKVLAPFFRASALGEKPFGRSSPTDPAFVIVDPRDFATERARLLAAVARFAERGPDSAGRAVHTFFGKLSGEEWGILMHKHIDHHLRQFGA